MVTFLILAAVLSVVVGLWLLNKKQNDSIVEVNNDVDHPFVDELAPEVTPAAIAETIAKKKAAPKKKATKKPAAKKSATKKSK